ncbi:dUTP diphosphatase [Aphelenchoides avenae]|nr:dUTP diphosphatase [Aphelenchus avenae]
MTLETENIAPVDAVAENPSAKDISVGSPKKAKMLEVDEGNKAVIEYVLVSEHARAPYVGSEKAAGADLCAAEDCIVPAGDRRLITTGLKIAIPEGYYGRIAPRSGLAVKHFIDTGAGVVDADYRGELKVLLFNFGKEDYEVKIGDRIAQVICEKIGHPVLKEVEQLSDTKRGSAGFGSTGVNNTNN